MALIPKYHANNFNFFLFLLPHILFLSFSIHHVLFHRDQCWQINRSIEFLVSQAMDPSEKEPHFSEPEEAIASMATVVRTLSPPDVMSHDTTTTHVNGNAISSNTTQANGTATGPSTRKISSKYRHIAAVHSSGRTSYFSRGAEITPSFLGFRNLMVIVLSTCFLVFKSYNSSQYRLQNGLTKNLYSCNEP